MSACLNSCHFFVCATEDYQPLNRATSSQTLLDSLDSITGTGSVGCTPLGLNSPYLPQVRSINKVKFLLIHLLPQKDIFNNFCVNLVSQLLVSYATQLTGSLVNRFVVEDSDVVVPNVREMK